MTGKVDVFYHAVPICSAFRNVVKFYFDICKVIRQAKLACFIILRQFVLYYILYKVSKRVKKMKFIFG
jgi:hypothetical protein